MNLFARLGSIAPVQGKRRTHAGGSTLRSLWLATALALVAPAAAARAPDDPLITVMLFRNALLEGSVGTALTLLAPDVLAYQAGSEERSRENYAKNQIKKDIAHLAAYYVDEKSQEHDIQDNFAWVSTRLRLLGKSIDKPVEHFGTETIVLRRSSSGWLIVHRHWSDSAQADTGG